jgi:SAM-dependent methyltransferase
MVRPTLVSIPALLFASACAPSHPAGSPPHPHGEQGQHGHEGHHGHHGHHGDSGSAGGHGDHTHHGQGMQHRFDGAEGWAKVFDAADRDAWQKPDVVLDAMALTETSLVADVGAGTGYFSVRLAKKVPKGRVYAVDVEADMVRYLDERAKREALANLVAVQGAPADPKLPEAVDAVLVVDTLHHIDAREAYFVKLRDKLRPKGRIHIVDFSPDATMGPPAKHRLSVDEVVATAKKAGLALVGQKTLPQQYLLSFGLPDGR